MFRNPISALRLPALALPALTVVVLSVAASSARAGSADAACGSASRPGWDVAGRLSQREHCMNGQAQAYRDQAVQGATQDVRQRVQAGRDAVDSARALPGQQLDRLRAAGTAEQNRLSQQAGASVAGALGGL
ncbi:hypothetical protein [Gluconacetobacter diazotrophicus]|uniref:hypothetical protein n=1 Tax=Gluconacetobacter diazotrophicus TaxID=33996 RepID=UPI001C7F3EF2|nr:hypothetical protein [Gluconacetobacter diazotrophicus]